MIFESIFVLGYSFLKKRGKKQQNVRIETTKTVAIAHLSNNVREWPEQMDATLAALKEKWKPLFAELMYLSSSIYEVALQGKTDPAKKQEAGKMAHRIIDLDEECDAIYLKRQHYLTYKTLPEEKKPIELVVDVKKIPKALANSERYVRDYKNKLKKNPADVFAAEKLKQYEWAVGEYKKQLNIE